MSGGRGTTTNETRGNAVNGRTELTERKQPPGTQPRRGAPGPRRAAAGPRRAVAAGPAVGGPPRPAGSRPGDARAADARAADAAPVGSRPRPAGARPSDAMPVGSRPRPAGARVAGARPADAPPASGQPRLGGARPSGTRPAGERPAGTRPAAAPPVPRRGRRTTPSGAVRTARPPQPGPRPTPESRTRFVFLVVGLLGGGLLCLLMINTILATGAFQITALQQGNVSLAQRVQSLQAQNAAEESPASLAHRAAALGMRIQPRLHFLNLKTGRLQSEPDHMPGIPAVPGYTP